MDFPFRKFAVFSCCQWIVSNMRSARTPLAITLSVWKALFLREALSRAFTGRAAWFWLIAEPVLHVAFLMLIFATARIQSVGGIDMAIWLMVGLLAFFMFRRTGMQVMNAVDSNQALFAYRQVKPVDSALVRAGLEGFLMAIIIMILLAGAALSGLSVSAADPLGVINAFLGIWLFGLGFGLVMSVAIELVPELSRIIHLIMMPLYIISGVMFPISAVPQPYRDWLLLNPVAHGLEAARLGFSLHYHSVPELSVVYLHGFALVSVFLGLALYRQFGLRMVTQ